MKGVKKCFGLSLLLSIMVGLSLSVSLDVNALKHDVNVIPIANPQFNGGLSIFPNLSVNFSSPNSVTFDNYVAPRLFGSSFNSSSNSCSFYRSAWNYSFSEGSIGFVYFPNDDSTSLITAFGSPICRQLRPFGSSVSLDESSLPPYVFGNPNYRDMLPYWYDYDGYYLKAKEVSSDTGANLSYIFKFSDVYGVRLNKFSSLKIPLGYVDDSVIGSERIGREMRFEGSFNFSGPGNYFNFSNHFLNNGSFDLFVMYLDPSSSNTASQRVSCSSNLVSLGSNDFLELQFTCPFIINSDLEYMGFYLDISVPVNSNDLAGSYVWDTNADYTFNTSFFVTDNDDTPGSSVLPHEVTGGNLESSPSGRYFANLNAEDDWFTKLVNGFNFNFVNPFAPIFGLFNSVNQCVEIPTIAGMLHAEDSTVCPWFDSTTRDIVTPVLGLSAMMLVFGFAVRWLGSRSGNFIEDSGGVDSGGYHFENKYRRGR